VRVVVVTCGAGASISFGLAERVVAELAGDRAAQGEAEAVA
jgi:hypothetical protein